MTAGGRARSPRRGPGGAPADLPQWLKDAAPRDLLATDPLPDGSMPRWPHGPFKDLADYPEAAAHLRQVANLARDAERFREGQTMTRAEVANKAGLNVQTYGDFEAGRTWPVASTLYRIADALDVDLRYLGRRAPGRGGDPRAAGRGTAGP